MSKHSPFNNVVRERVTFRELKLPSQEGIGFVLRVVMMSGEGDSARIITPARVITLSQQPGHQTLAAEITRENYGSVRDGFYRELPFETTAIDPSDGVAFAAQQLAIVADKVPVAEEALGYLQTAGLVDSEQ